MAIGPTAAAIVMPNRKALRIGKVTPLSAMGSLPKIAPLDRRVPQAHRPALRSPSFDAWTKR
jgi:hypothetical protein